MKISEITKKNIFLLICLSLLITSFFILYEVIYPFVLAFILAYLLSPLTEKLNFYLPRSLAAFISIILFILIVFCVLSLIIPIIIVQFEKIVILAPQYISKLSEYIYSNFSFIIKEKSLNSDNFLNFVKLFLIKIGKTGYDFFQGSIIFLNGIFDVFFTLILSFYMLLELKNVKKFTLNLTNLTSFSFFSNILEDINLTLSNYIRGQGLICLTLSIFYSLLLYLTGLDFGIILGIFVGIISFIPYIGATIGVFIALVLGGIQFGLNHELLLILLVFIFGQLFESYYLTPKFVGDAIKLNPIWIIFALSIGGNFFGFIGILISIPLAAIIGVISRYWFNSLFIDIKK